ncbi:MAG: phage integrase N-terminal SAM-like domain-containing protein [Planctomycetes bacterium]|nr:phage integrase N-terminal SAM-like domain-containing protein [Planctomycetota bacterium]
MARTGALATALPARIAALPAIVEQAGTAAHTAWRDFFSGKLPNDYTRAAYAHAVRRFLVWCENTGHRELHRITPGDLGDYFRQHTGALATKKQHLSGIRRFFNLLVERHLCLINPAAAVAL